MQVDPFSKPPPAAAQLEEFQLLQAAERDCINEVRHADRPVRAQCTNVPMQQCPNGPMPQGTNDPTQQCINCTTAPMHQCTNAPLHHCTNQVRDADRQSKDLLRKREEEEASIAETLTGGPVATGAKESKVPPHLLVSTYDTLRHKFAEQVRGSRCVGALAHWGIGALGLWGIATLGQWCTGALGH
jgi:hypothetical protein